MKSALVATLITLAAALPARAGSECRRADDASFTPKQRQLISAARGHLESAHKRALDACFEVSRGMNGNTFVTVTHVAGYRDGKPYFQPGGHTGIEFNSHGKIVRVHGGA
jgi:hypothetical protein